MVFFGELFTAQDVYLIRSALNKALHRLTDSYAILDEDMGERLRDDLDELVQVARLLAIVEREQHRQERQEAMKGKAA